MRSLTLQSQGAQTLGIGFHSKFNKAIPSGMQEDQVSVGHSSVGSNFNPIGRGNVKLNVHQSLTMGGPDVHSQENLNGIAGSVATISVIN